MHQQSVIHVIIFLIDIILPSATVVGNISTAVQALCAPRGDCGMDGRSRLLRRETGGLLRGGGNLSQWGEKPNTAGEVFLSGPINILKTNTVSLMTVGIPPPVTGIFFLKTGPVTYERRLAYLVIGVLT